MKILHVITSLRTGGAEHLLIDLLPQLRKLGNEVELLLFDGEETPFLKEMEKTGIKIHILGNGSYDPKYVLKMVKFVKEFDIVHTHNTPCQFAAAVAKTLAFRGAKLVTTEHSSNNRRRGKWYFKLLDKWVYSKYSSIIVISDQPRENLENYIGKLKTITTIYNGVDLSKFQQAKRTRKEDGKILITMVASLSAAKDQDTIIRALGELPEKYRVQLVGKGHRQKELESLVDSLQLKDRVDFLGVRSDIPQILVNSDINVMSSHWEGLSLSSIEGMSCGRPFIASDVDGLREVVKGHGVVFPHQDYQTLAKEIIRLTEDKDYADQIIRQCQAKAAEYDIKVMAEKYNEVYKTLMKK